MNNEMYNDQNIARYFAGELDDKSIEVMERDLLNDNEKEQQMKDFARIWDKSAEISTFEKLDVDADWNKVKQRMGIETRQKRIPLGKYLLRISAILVLAFGLAYLFASIIRTVPAGNGTEYYQVASAEEVKDVVLPDNSVITLNKGAKVYYKNNFGSSNRDLILEGEAFCEISRNENLPFKIYIENSTIEVLGTSFNIKPVKNNIQVSVVSGKVAFYETASKQNGVELIKNEQAEYHIKTKTFEEKKAANPNSLAWKTKMFTFKNESFTDAFALLEDFFNIEIRSTAILPTDGINGDFKVTESFEEILEDILDATEGEYEIVAKENTVTIKEKG